jgi:lysozyme family protein
MVGFFSLLVLLLSLYASNEELSKNQLINICIGALVAAFSTVVNFWLGSSKGSRDKDEAQAVQTTEILKAQAQQTASALNTASTATVKAAAATAVAATAAQTGGAPLADTPKTDDTTNFNKCLAIVFTEEGGYTNDPNDPGGPTNFGITIADLKEWRGRDVTPDDVKNMTKDEAREIYRSKYWNPMQCGDLPDGLDLEVFDFGVNAGTRTSIKKLQDVLGVKDDGSIGPITMAACKVADPRTVIQGFSARRLDYYRSLAGFAHFGVGWTNRTNAVEKAALAMIATPQGTVVSV